MTRDELTEEVQKILNQPGNARMVHAVRYVREQMSWGFAQARDFVLHLKENTTASMHIDDVNVQIAVEMNAVLTLGLYSGSITREIIAQHIKDMNPMDLITKIQVIGLNKDDGTQLVEGGFDV